MVPDNSARECAYRRRLSTPSLPGVELWWVELDLYAARVPLIGLPANDHATAATFTFGTDARRFLARRHALRAILAARTGLSPDALIFGASRFGKPFLHNATGLHFSSSQSVSEAAIAVGGDQPVGVDVEVVREIIDADALAQLHFTANERAAWLREAGLQADRAFLTCWTRKEACVKALGTGFRLSPESIDAGCSDGMRVVKVLNPHGPSCEVEIESSPSPLQGVVAVARLNGGQPASQVPAQGQKCCRLGRR